MLSRKAIEKMILRKAKRLKKAWNIYLKSGYHSNKIKDMIHVEIDYYDRLITYVGFFITSIDNEENNQKQMELKKK